MSSSDPDGRLKYITREEASDIALVAAKEASRQTLNETFGMLGVNLANFESMQSFRDDLEWARRGRHISERTGARAWTALVTVAAGGFAIGLWEYIRMLIGRHP